MKITLKIMEIPLKSAQNISLGILMFWFQLISILLAIFRPCECSLPCDIFFGVGCKYSVKHSFFPSSYFKKHHPPQQQIYLPAPPGKSPSCAQPGATFCEKVDRYPGDVIQSLVTRTRYNFRSLFADETGEGFAERERERKTSANSANPVDGRGNYAGQSSNQHQTSARLEAPPNQFGFNIFNNSSTAHDSSKGVYPDRQYHLPESATRIVDPALYDSFVQPSIELTPYSSSSVEWWKRPEREINEESFSPSSVFGKNKRQVPPGASAAGNELCPTKSQFIMPKAAVNSKGEWKYVVNIDQGKEKYTQLIRSETCLTSECSNICSVPNGYKSKCEQKFVQKRLIALEGTGNNLYTDVFWFPHCCICQIAPNIT